MPLRAGTVKAVDLTLTDRPSVAVSYSISVTHFNPLVGRKRCVMAKKTAATVSLDEIVSSEMVSTDRIPELRAKTAAEREAEFAPNPFQGSDWMERAVGEIPIIEISIMDVQKVGIQIKGKFHPKSPRRVSVGGTVFRSFWEAVIELGWSREGEINPTGRQIIAAWALETKPWVERQAQEIRKAGNKPYVSLYVGDTETLSKEERKTWGLMLQAVSVS